jgi:hypothetical protein
MTSKRDKPIKFEAKQSLPFLLRFGERIGVERDESTRGTRKTAIGRETTDDE